MNVADAPAHIGFVPDVWSIEILGITVGFTVIVIPDEDTGVGLAQSAFEVIEHVTT